MTAFVLIHGAGHDGWLWHLVESQLQAAGHQTASPDLPCDDPDAGLADYVETVLSCFDAFDEDPVVVGHSLGALTATMVAARHSVRALVFVGGIIPLPGTSLADRAEADADRDLPMGDDAIVIHVDGTFSFSPAGAIRLLYHDCDAALAEEAISHLRPQRSMWKEVCTARGWPDRPMRAIVGTQERMVSVDWTRRVARERLGVEAELIEAGHSPMLSKPAELAALLMQS